MVPVLQAQLVVEVQLPEVEQAQLQALEMLMALLVLFQPDYVVVELQMSELMDRAQEKSQRLVMMHVMVLLVHVVSVMLLFVH
jgi:hypothetical protein